MNLHPRGASPFGESTTPNRDGAVHRGISLSVYAWILALASMTWASPSAAQESPEKSGGRTVDRLEQQPSDSLEKQALDGLDQQPSDSLDRQASDSLDRQAPIRHERPAAARFEPEIRAFEARDERHPPPKNAVLFVGSSSIAGWESLESDFPHYTTIRRGFGGSEISDVIHYAGRIVLPYAPRLIVLYAGDNDIAAGKSPGRVADDYRAFVDLVHDALPQTRILFIAIKPSLARRHVMDRMRAANTLIKFYARSDARLGFVDVFEPMLDAAGNPRPELFVEDGLHMNARGYALWQRILEPHLAHP